MKFAEYTRGCWGLVVMRVELVGDCMIVLKFSLNLLWLSVDSSVH